MIEKIWNYKNHPCVVRVMEDLQGNKLWRCGYVGVLSNSVFYDDAETAEETLLPHGGMTYCGNRVPEMPIDSAYYWIGFDCNHALDACSAEEAKEDICSHYWTLEEVIEECNNLVESIITIEKDIAEANKPDVALVEDVLENMLSLARQSHDDVCIKVYNFDNSNVADYIVYYKNKVYSGDMWIADNGDVHLRGELF